MLNRETHDPTLVNGQKRDPKPNSSQRALRYKHILAPTALAHTDRAALQLAFEWAVLHRAKLTVLHVANVLPLVTEPSMHWLDAIDRLYMALDRNRPRAGPHEAVQMALPCVRKFLEHVVPEHLREEVDMCVECCAGDVADQIVRVAEDDNADVVILSGGPPRWWAPAVPDIVRRVLRSTERQVVLIHRNLRSKQRENTNCD